MGLNIPTVFDEGVITRPMTLEESEMFVTLKLSQIKGRPSKVVKGKDLAAEFSAHFKTEFDALPFLLKVGIQRLTAGDPEGEFDLDMVMWAFAGLADRVGVVVLWAYGLSKGRVRVNGQAITLDHWATILHPNGPPTNEELFRIWDAQKCHVLGVKGDNYLDLKEAWE